MEFSKKEVNDLTLNLNATVDREHILYKKVENRIIRNIINVI